MLEDSLDFGMENNDKVKYVKETFNLPFGEGYGTSVQEVITIGSSKMRGGVKTFFPITEDPHMWDNISAKDMWKGNYDK